MRETTDVAHGCSASAYFASIVRSVGTFSGFDTTSKLPISRPTSRATPFSLAANCVSARRARTGLRTFFRSRVR